MAPPYRDCFRHRAQLCTNRAAISALIDCEREVQKQEFGRSGADTPSSESRRLRCSYTMAPKTLNPKPQVLLKP